MKQNEFKFSTLRQFGAGENISFNTTIYSENNELTDEEIDAVINNIDKVMTKSFRSVEERNISDKDILAEFADKRREAMKKYDDAVKLEMEQVRASSQTAREAQKLSDKLSRK